MNQMPTKLRARADRKTAKRDEKKRQIADSAIKALKELGYANTSLRDIAAKSDLSLGMLHYYFEDRSDLIIYCVQLYKEAFVRDINTALNTAEGRDAVLDAFADALAGSIVDDTETHRLWYDIRTQAMFDETFRPVVDEIEAMLIDIVRHAFGKTGNEIPPMVAIHYAALDGVFRMLMQNQLTGDLKTKDELAAIFRALLTQFF
jgi:AcrR family transcriptional regulator